MDVHAGVTAFKSRDLNAPGRTSACGNQLYLAPSGCVHATRTTDAQGPDLFGIEVEKILGFQHARREFRSAGEPGFLVNGEGEFERTVGDVRAFHDGKCSGHANAVVCAECGAIGLQPIAIPYNLDRIGVEVVMGPFVLLANHVKVALQKSYWSLLASFVCGFADYEIANMVLR